MSQCIGKKLLSFKPYLKRVLFRLNPALAKQDIDDLISDTYVRIIANKNIDTENDNFRGYVAQALRNMYIDSFRDKKKKCTINSRIPENYVEKIGSNLKTCIDHDLIKKAMANKLSKSEIGIFNLLITGMRQFDIAHTLEINEKTIRAHVFRIRKKLHKFK